MVPSRVGRRVDLAALLRAAAGLVVLAWLPGYVWVRAALPGMEGVARHVAAVALSVAMVTLALYGGNVLLSLPVAGSTAIWYALAFAALGLGRLAWPRVAASIRRVSR